MPLPATTSQSPKDTDLVYEAPRVELVLTHEELAREIQYAGTTSGIIDDQELL